MKASTYFLDCTDLGMFFGSYKTFIMEFEKFLAKKGLVLTAYDEFIQVIDPTKETVLRETVIKKIPVYKDRVIVKDTGQYRLDELKKTEDAMLSAYKQAWKDATPKPKIIEKEKIVRQTMYIQRPREDDSAAWQLKYRQMIDGIKKQSRENQQFGLVKSIAYKLESLAGKLGRI